MGRQNGVGAGLGKQHPPRNALERDGAQRIYIGAPVHMDPGDLFGCRVVRGPDPLPLAGYVGAGCEAARQANIRQVGMIHVSEQNVGGLDVTVHDCALVEGIQRTGDLTDDARDHRERERPIVLNQGLEVSAGDVGRHDAERRVHMLHGHDRQ